MEYIKSIKVFKAGDIIPHDATLLHIHITDNHLKQEVEFYYEVSEFKEQPKKEFYPEASC